MSSVVEIAKCLPDALSAFCWYANSASARPVPSGRLPEHAAGFGQSRTSSDSGKLCQKPSAGTRRPLEQIEPRGQSRHDTLE